MVSEPDEKSLLPYFNIVSEPYLHFEKVGEETEKKLLMGKPAKEFFSSIWDRNTIEPIPLNELVKLIVSKDNSKNTDKAKDGNARKRIDRGIKYGTLRKDELKNITFGGTSEEWRKMTSHLGQASDNGKITVRCSDGEMKFDLY